MPYAIITGATQGIGKAIAETFLKNGIDVAICARSAADIQAVHAEWTTQYPNRNIIALQADLSQKDQAVGFADKVLEIFPTIDILVNNAGLYFPGTLADEPEGQLEFMMGVNLYSAYYITRHVLPVMRKQNSGHIFNMCSVASLKAYPNGGAYSITKYALLGFSDNLRYELKDENIKVTAISSGAVYSRSWEGSGIDPQRIMEVSDIATMVWATYSLSQRANVENIIIRPQKGDL
ncbi:MAG: SDR family oxidoreductase [Flavipsychrobacter sp.]